MLLWRRVIEFSATWKNPYLTVQGNVKYCKRDFFSFALSIQHPFFYDIYSRIKLVIRMQENLLFSKRRYAITILVLIIKTMAIIYNSDNGVIIHFYCVDCDDVCIMKANNLFTGPRSSFLCYLDRSNKNHGHEYLLDSFNSFFILYFVLFKPVYAIGLSNVQVSIFSLTTLNQAKLINKSSLGRPINLDHALEML